MAMREWLDSAGGKIVTGALLLVAVAVVFIAVKNAFGPSAEVAEANKRVFIDADTGKSFTHTLKEGDVFPVKAPSGKEVGYPAELCYWTRDGQIKEEPTAVLLNEWVGKSGPTFCPDCGRLVRGHNPRPQPGDPPPPTQQQHRGSPQGDR